MRVLNHLSRLSAQSTIAMALMLAIVALPAVGLRVTPFEQFDTDDDQEPREVELTTPGQSVQPLPALGRLVARLGLKSTSPVRGNEVAKVCSRQPLRESLGSRLRC
jgi:hypothetical protein